MHLATALPRWLVVGVDACREPLRQRSAKAAPNALFVIANALTLPGELDGIAHDVDATAGPRPSPLGAGSARGADGAFGQGDARDDDLGDRAIARGPA